MVFGLAESSGTVSEDRLVTFIVRVGEAEQTLSALLGHIEDIASLRVCVRHDARKSSLGSP